MQGGKIVTRAELMTALDQAGIPTASQRGYHILWQLAQDALICLGPNQGKQATFVWLADWLPKVPEITREESLTRLTQTYFTSHGPATIQDYMWWSGLTAADVRAGLKLAGSNLVAETIEGSEYYLSPNHTDSPSGQSHVYFLPGFDEYLLGYKNRTAVLEPTHSQKVVPGSNGMFLATIVLDGQVVGTWKKTATKTKIKISFNLFNDSTKLMRKAMAEATDLYQGFIGAPVEDVDS